jgi:DNA-directed RNA polymerase subunit RPC12/RpoP
VLFIDCFLPYRQMPRKCNQCNSQKSSDDYSKNQWQKGEGNSRCQACVIGYKCSVCCRNFDNPNALKMHIQTHRSRDVTCPVCNDRTFRSGANAVQHVESGFCSGCPGKTKAREQIHNFAIKQRAMHRYVTELPLLTYSGNYEDDDVPEYPYKCPDCNRNFKQLSQLLQHQDNKHDATPLRLTSS